MKVFWMLKCTGVFLLRVTIFQSFCCLQIANNLLRKKWPNEKWELCIVQISGILNKTGTDWWFPYHEVNYWFEFSLGHKLWRSWIFDGKYRCFNHKNRGIQYSTYCNIHKLRYQLQPQNRIYLSLNIFRSLHLLDCLFS